MQPCKRQKYHQHRFKLHLLKDQIAGFILIDRYAFYWEHNTEIVLVGTRPTARQRSVTATGNPISLPWALHCHISPLITLSTVRETLKRLPVPILNLVTTNQGCLDTIRKKNKIKIPSIVTWGHGFCCLGWQLLVGNENHQVETAIREKIIWEYQSVLKEHLSCWTLPGPLCTLPLQSCTEVKPSEIKSKVQTLDQNKI